ncbi:MAG: DUF6776 family protein [Acidiferrobacteraceae bacterium]
MMPNLRGDVVVRSRSSRTVRILAIAGVALLAVLAGIGLYRRGLLMAGYDRVAAITREQRLQQRIDRLVAENQTLRQGLAVAQRSLEMDQAAYHDLHRSLGRSARRIVKLEERVDLYRTVLSPRTPIEGVTIERLTLRRVSGQRYRYALILVQPFEARGSVSGILRFKITGLSAGYPVELAFPGQVDKAIPVRFKYFQDVEGILEFPHGFSPRFVNVDVRAEGRRIQKRFRWPASG